jgi:hypothetical protein
VDDASALISLKGITKKMFLKYLEEAGLYKSIEEEWGEIKQSLEVCGIGYKELLKYKAGWRDMCATLIKESNSIPLQRLADNIRFIIEQDYTESSVTNKISLLEIVNETFPKVFTSIYDEYLTKCLIIKKLNEE